MRLITGLAFVIAFALGEHAAAAAPMTINQGFNITGQNIVQFLLGLDAAAVPVPFYDATDSAINDDVGTELKPLTIIPPGLPNNTYSLTFDAAAVFGTAGPLTSGTLFVDAIDLEAGDAVDVFINGLLLGPLANASSPAPIPLPGGGFTMAAGETDNTIFLLPVSVLAALTTDPALTISFARSSGRVVLDGLNLQATSDVVRSVDPIVPEPGTIVLLGGGLVGLLRGTARRRTHAAASARVGQSPPRASRRALVACLR